MSCGNWVVRWLCSDNSDIPTDSAKKREEKVKHHRLKERKNLSSRTYAIILYCIVSILFEGEDSGDELNLGHKQTPKFFKVRGYQTRKERSHSEEVRWVLVHARDLEHRFFGLIIVTQQ